MIRTFKEALHELLHRSQLPAKQLAELLGKNYTRLCNCANDTQETEHLYGRDIVPLTLTSRNDVLVDWLCTAVGGAFIRLPEASASELNRNLLEMVQHMGELSRATQAALEDSRISKVEGVELESIIQELVKHCLTFAVEVGRQVGKG